MRPRLPLRRILFLRPFRPPNPPRTFTHNTLNPRSRPQLPFLSARSRRPAGRYISTEKKQWFKNEIKKAGKYTVVVYVGVALVLVTIFGVQQEWEERKFPTPSEWSWISRKDSRSTRYLQSLDGQRDHIVDWVYCAGTYLRTLKRLENPEIDGKDLVAQEGKTGWDISMKSEPWRRGYFEILMGLAKSAEHLDGWVMDRRRQAMFPGDVVLGPSVKTPRPMPPGSMDAPKEEDCDPGFEEADNFYIKALTTKGFTERQRVEAALAYAEWLEYKNNGEAALEMLQTALGFATKDAPKSLVNLETAVLNPSAGKPSANILAASTAIAVHYSRNEKFDVALPIFLSVLRARKSLPPSPKTLYSQLNQEEVEESTFDMIFNFLKSALVAPSYPLAPPDGTLPPFRDAKERCEEAAVMTYIGSILYASKTSRTSKEDGLAWTREAVDIAEEELRTRGANGEAKKVCRDCLGTGLDNWSQMVREMAKLEIETPKLKRTGWLWDTKEAEVKVVGRWESEEMVVRERIRRAEDVLDKDMGKKSESVGGFVFV